MVQLTIYAPRSRNIRCERPAGMQSRSPASQQAPMEGSAGTSDLLLFAQTVSPARRRRTPQMTPDNNPVIGRNACTGSS
jgi:hypothetical protein